MAHEIRTWLNGRIALHRGDCRDILPALAGADALVSDPPYGIGYQHGGKSSRLVTNALGVVTMISGASHGPSRAEPITGDDEPFDPAHLLDLAPRVLLWGADHYRARLPEGGRFLCWDKSVGIGPADSFADAEFAWTNLPGVKRTVFRHLWKGIAHKKDLIDLRNKTGGNGRFHVSQKPVALMRWCIEHLRVRPGGTVLDPYMGSGSTALAAISLGLGFTGVEIDEEHFQTACARVDAALAFPEPEPGLFAEGA